jgi:hypothetical protein
MLAAVDSYALPQNGSGLRAARGRLGLWVPCPSLLVIAIQGHGHAEFATAILESHRTLRPQAPVHLFADVEEMTTYDSRLRTELSAGFLPDRTRIAAFHVLLKSKLVAMGVSVANLALGGIVKITTERPQFTQILDTCLFENRVVGFSSGVLDSLRLRTRIHD